MWLADKETSQRRFHSVSWCTLEWLVISRQLPVQLAFLAEHSRANTTRSQQSVLTLEQHLRRSHWTCPLSGRCVPLNTCQELSGREPGCIQLEHRENTRVQTGAAAEESVSTCRDTWVYFKWTWSVKILTPPPIGDVTATHTLHRVRCSSRLCWVYCRNMMNQI